MSQPVPETMTNWRRLYYTVWAIIGVILLVAAGVWGLGRIIGALAPFVVAFIFVFLLQGPVRHLVGRGVKRPLAVGVCFLVAFVVIVVGLIFLLPPIGKQLVAFASAMPGYLESGKSLVYELRDRYLSPDVATQVGQLWDALSNSVGSMFVKFGNAIANSLVSAGSGVATIVFDLVMGAVVAFWVLKDLPKMREEMRVLAGEKYEADLEVLVSTVGRVVGGYLRGQSITSLATGAIVGIGLWVIGVRYALVIGILAVVLNFVPYVGPLITALIAAGVGLFSGWLPALGAVIVCVAAQQVADLFISPRVMSEQVDLHPVLVIFSLLVGGALLGTWGMIFAIPFAATAKGLFVYYWERRNDRELASEDGALFRAPSCDEGEPETDCEVDASAPSASQDHQEKGASQ